MKPLKVAALVRFFVSANQLFDSFLQQLHQEIRRNEEILTLSKNVEQLESRSIFEVAAKTINPYMEHYQDKPKDFEKYLTAMLVVDQKSQKEYLERNRHLHAFMKPFLDWVPTSDFRGHVVEYGQVDICLKFLSNEKLW